MIPILGLIYFSSELFIQELSEQKQLKQLKYFLNDSIKISGLVHELQKERGLSAGLIGSKYTKFKEVLREQRKLTDAKLADLKQNNNSLKFLKNNKKNILKELENLSLIRKQVDKKQISFKDTLKYYSNINNKFLDFISRLSLIRQNDKMTQMGIAYVSLLRAKEASGIERAVLNNVFASGKMTYEVFKKFSVLNASHQTYIMNYKTLINKKKLDIFNQKMSDNCVYEVKKLREVAFAKVNKDRIISEIKQNAGYGGLIHSFKNYVLRGEEIYANNFNKKYKNIKLLIQEYNSMASTTKKEKELLSIIMDTFTMYKFGLKNVIKSHKKNHSIRYLDKIVKVDDKPAIEALNILSNNILDTSATDWFKVSTQRINILQDIETSFVLDMKNKMESLSQEIQKKFFINLAIFIVIIILLLIISTKIIYNITSSMQKFQNGLMTFFDYLTNKREEINPIQITSNDEFGQMAKVINENILKSKIYIEKFNQALTTQIDHATAASKAKSEFLANMSHEIRTPLNAVLGFIDLLKEDTKGRKSENYVNIIDDSSKTLLKIIEDILDFSKIESGKLDIEKVDFCSKYEFEVITHLFDAKCSQKNISLVLNLDENIPPVINSDPFRIKQIISNLLSNAIKFSGDGEKVIVSISYNEQRIFVSVQDQGIGISKNKLEHIFESFNQEDNTTTRNYGGTGLGLSISSELVALLGGELKVKSEEGVGSEFYFSIPVSIGKRVDCSIGVLDNSDFKNIKLLLVEDNKSNQIFMKVVLDKMNIKFDIANDGVEAISMFKTNSYDIVLMDENMPNMNGIEATKHILEYEKENSLEHTQIVALTANALKGDRERFLNSGMDEYLTKPLDKNKLSKILQNVMK